MKRKFTALLAMLIIAQTAVSCGGSGSSGDTSTTPDNPSDTTTAPSTTAEPEPLGLDPTLKFPDYDFRVFVREEQEFHTDEETGNVVNDAIFKRLQTVEDLFDCDITVRTATIKGDSNEEALAPLQAGEDVYDLILTHGRSAFKFVAAGVTTDWYDVPNIDHDRSWWNQDMRENLEINGKLYAMTGGLTLDNLQRTSALFFSHPLLTDYQLEFPYQLVRNGEWTLDVFETYIKNFSQDINDDGAYDAEHDLLGYVESGWGGCVYRFYTTGTKIVSRDNDGVPRLTLYNDKTVDLYDRMFQMLDSNYAALDLDGKFMNTSFDAGRLAFYSGVIEHVETRTDLEMDFGVLPYPKYDETIDRYYQLVDGGSSLAIIPITVEDLARTGAITEALAYYGQKYLFPAYYDNALMNRFLRDEDSVEMMEIIRQSQTYDLAYSNNAQFGGRLANPGRSLAVYRNYTLTTYYEENKSATETLIEQSMKLYSED